MADVENDEAVVGATSGEKIPSPGRHLCGARVGRCGPRGRQARAPAASSCWRASCCHPQISCGTYAGRAWLEGHGIDGSAFGVLRDVVRATRAPRPEDRFSPVPATPGTLDARESRRVGVVARRADRGRRGGARSWTGQFEGTATFGDTTLTKCRQNDIFLIADRVSGAIDWAVRAFVVDTPSDSGVAHPHRQEPGRGL